MTAEIAVMNEEAIALAADSAVSGPKIFTSANKIFALSKYHPVAVMVFANAQFLNVPWETIIKQYRRELGSKSFDTLAEHADHFVSFFHGTNRLFPPDAQARAVANLAQTLFGATIRDTEARLAQTTPEGTQLSEEEIAHAVEGTIAEQHSRWKSARKRKGLPKGYLNTVAQKYRTQIDDALSLVFGEVELSKKAHQQLKQLVPSYLVCDDFFWRSPQRSGIVIAGFGSRDVFPRLRRFQFEGVVANRLKFKEGEAVDIGHNNRAVISPFAQDEEVRTFIQGIDPRIHQFLKTWWPQKLLELVDEAGEHLGLSQQKGTDLLEVMAPRCAEIASVEYQAALEQFQRETNVDPILNVVGMLPKDELAAMAEALVNLTSFKRRVTEEEETVGGPIDVAVISRGDGFIWIKRKHYFSQELNPQFLANYYRRDEAE